MLEHGGRVGAAARCFGIPVAHWLDLSTGIAPWSCPIPGIPEACWRCLPEDGDGLEAAAADYYGNPRVLALPGSQAAIQGLARLRGAETVAVLAPSYGEYAAAWQGAGHRVVRFAADALEAAAERATVVILANPNNPDGRYFSRSRLLALARSLALRGGWLIVDEAFADADADETLAVSAGTAEGAGLIVLRSLGKFFGLAGARVGFILAGPDVVDRLREFVGPWAVAHPARWAARHALANRTWQSSQRQALQAASSRLADLLRQAGWGDPSGTALFRYLVRPDAETCYRALARRGILVRHFAAPAALRFGLPGNEAEWQRLRDALVQVGDER